MTVAAQRALDFIGHSALLTESANRDLSVSVSFLLFRSLHGVFQPTVGIGGTKWVVEFPIFTFLDGSLR